jgi:hypothetical protein
LRDAAEDIEAAGAELVFVGNGTPEQARYFAERYVPGFTVLTDPERRLYDGLGMVRSMSATFGVGSVVVGATALLRGHHQTALAGDAWQQGGLVVLKRGGVIAYAQRNRSAGDRPDLGAALAALGAKPTRASSRRASGKPRID